MAKTVNEVAIKGRQTKLEKKSFAELIQIILKKDKIERNLNTQIINLKAEVNSLNNRIKGYKADMNGEEEIISKLREEVKHLNESCKTKSEQIDAAKLEAKENADKYATEVKTNVALTNACKSYKKLAWTFAIGFALAVVAWISCLL